MGQKEKDDLFKTKLVGKTLDHFGEHLNENYNEFQELLKVTRE